jgi:hypothetical protein
LSVEKAVVADASVLLGHGVVSLSIPFSHLETMQWSLNISNHYLMMQCRIAEELNILFKPLGNPKNLPW